MVLTNWILNFLLWLRARFASILEWLPLTSRMDLPIVMTDRRGLNTRTAAQNRIALTSWISFIQQLDFVFSCGCIFNYFVFAVKECVDGEKGREEVVWRNAFLATLYVVYYHSTTKVTAMIIKKLDNPYVIPSVQILINFIIFISPNDKPAELFQRLIFAIGYVVNEMSINGFLNEFKPTTSIAGPVLEVVLLGFGLIFGVCIRNIIDSAVAVGAWISIGKVIVATFLQIAMRNKEFTLHQMWRRRMHIIEKMEILRLEAATIEKDFRIRLPIGVGIDEEQKKLDDVNRIRKINNAHNKSNNEFNEGNAGPGNRRQDSSPEPLV